MKKQHKIQFSKKLAVTIVIFSMAIVAVTVLLNFILLWFGLQPMTDETVTVISTFGGVTATIGTAAYSVLTCVRDTSLNKHGLIVQEDNKKYLDNPNIGQG